jgi:polyhydroxybutyrate depolymerase
MNKLLLTICAVLSLSATTFSQTTELGSFEIDGQLRNYRVYIPASYNPEVRCPLVFNLHGYGSNAIEQENYGDFRAIADTANFIIVHPNGSLDALGIQHWNTFGTSSVDDVKFLSALIDTMNANYAIDKKRVYSTGMSNGGFMSYKLACQLSGRITAVASVTGTMTVGEFDACMTNHPMPVMQIHGTEDPTVPYEGSAFFKSVDEVVNHWVDFNECSPTPEIIEVPDIDPTDSSTATHFIFSDGLLGSTVELYRINEGEHTWPGSIFVDAGRTNNDINASKEIWRFFSQYELSYLTSSIPENTEKGGFSIYPNPSEGSSTIYFETTENRTISIYSMSGQLISTNNSTAKIFELSFNDPGIYLINVLENGQNFQRKLVNQ